MVTNVVAGDKQIGDTIKGSFRYDLDAPPIYQQHPTTPPYPVQYLAFPTGIKIDENTIHHPYGTQIYLTDWIDENKKVISVSSDGYLEDGNTNVRLSLSLEGPEIFDSDNHLPAQLDYSNVLTSNFEFSISVPEDPNSYTENYQGHIESITCITHPTIPQVLIIENHADRLVLHSYGTLKQSTNLLDWVNSPTHPFEPRAPLVVQKDDNPQMFFKAVE